MPEKPVLHAHVKEPMLSEHVALVSQLLDPSAVEGHLFSRAQACQGYSASSFDTTRSWRS